MAHARLHGLVVAGVLAASLAACGEDREGSLEVEGGTGTGTQTTSTSASTSTTTVPADKPSSSFFDVSETEFRLRPANFRIGEAGVIVFRVTNDGGTVHALEVEGPTGEFETEEIQPGGDATLKADVSKEGTYELYCPVGDHEERGMVGKLIVGRASGGESGDSGGTTVPEDDTGSGSEDSGGDDDTGGAAAPGY